MTIDEAIKGLRDEVIEAEDEGALRVVAYLKLGIEALRVILKAREGNYASFKLPLPGETEK